MEKNVQPKTINHSSSRKSSRHRRKKRTIFDKVATWIRINPTIVVGIIFAIIFVYINFLFIMFYKNHKIVTRPDIEKQKDK